MKDLFGDPIQILRVIDFEATGLDPDCEVVEYGFCDFAFEQQEILASGSSLCRVSNMPPEARAIHHIRLEEARAFPPYDRRVLFEEAIRAGAVGFAAHSADFEARYIIGHLPLVCTYKAALRVWPDAPSHSVFGLLYWLEDNRVVSYDRDRAFPPHRAESDAYATAVLLKAIYAAGYTGRDLAQWTREPAMLPRCPIGDWRGHRWEEIEDSFLEWILRKIYDREDVRFCAERELDRREELRHEH